MIYLLDTNVLSRVARGVDPALSRQVQAHLLDCRLSAVVWFELQYGAARSEHPYKALPRLALLRKILPDVEVFDDQAARLAGEIRAQLETIRPNAHPIGLCDTLIAGHALALGAT